MPTAKHQEFTKEEIESWYPSLKLAAHEVFAMMVGTELQAAPGEAT